MILGEKKFGCSRRISVLLTRPVHSSFFVAVRVEVDLSRLGMRLMNEGSVG